MSNDSEQLPPAEVFRTKQQLAYDVIRRSILSLRFKPGQRLVIGDLAHSIGVSSNPVREALSRLEAEGLVNAVPHTGATVVGFTPETVEMQYRIRGVLAGFAMLCAAPILAERPLAEARELLGEMDEAVLTADTPRWQELNNRFHDTLLNACGIPHLVSLIGTLKRQGPSYDYFPDHVQALAPESQAEHHVLLQALMRRDGAGAETLTRAHYRRAGAAFRHYLEQRFVADRNGGDEQPVASPRAPELAVRS